MSRAKKEIVHPVSGIHAVLLAPRKLPPKWGSYWRHEKPPYPTKKRIRWAALKCEFCHEVIEQQGTWTELEPYFVVVKHDDKEYVCRTCWEHFSKVWTDLYWQKR